MAIDLHTLKGLLGELGLRFYVDPNRPMLLLGGSGFFGNYQAVVHLDLDGAFLQLRSLRYFQCPADHPNFLQVLRAIVHENYRFRTLKLGWDPEDGEVAAYADYWVADGTITTGQLDRLLGGFFIGVDTVYPRLRIAMDTGEDPGPMDRSKMVRFLRDRLSSLPPELREKVRGLIEAAGGDGDIDQI